MNCARHKAGCRRQDEPAGQTAASPTYLTNSKNFGWTGYRDDNRRQGCRRAILDSGMITLNVKESP